MPSWLRSLGCFLNRPYRLCLLGLLFGLMTTGSVGLSPHPDVSDSSQYTLAAYNLQTYGVFNETADPSPVVPGLGREPGWPLVLAGLRFLSPSLAETTASCLAAHGGCGPEPYGIVIWTQRLFVLFSGLLLFGTVFRVTHHGGSAFAAGMILWVNPMMQSSMDHAVSDYLGLVCLCLFLWTSSHIVIGKARQTTPIQPSAAPYSWSRSFLHLWHGVFCHGPKERQRLYFWSVCSGLALAGLILTKAVYFYFFFVLLVILLGLSLFYRPNRSALPGAPVERIQKRHVLFALFIFSLVALLPPLAWMKRNADLGGPWSVAGDSRAGIALSTRVVFHDLDWEQGLAAMLFWTRGFGDDATKALFEKEVWAPLQFYEPGGYYLRGQLGFGQRAKDYQKTHSVNAKQAEKAITAQIVDQMISSPGTHLVTNIPLFYRGIWVDEYIIVTLPFLLWMTTLLLIKGRWIGLLLFLPSWFSLSFYSLFSLNIPRYQITATPGLALAGGLGVLLLLTWWQSRALQRRQSPE